jgi:hypothetical protein
MLNHHKFFVIEQEIISFEKICILVASKSSHYPWIQKQIMKLSINIKYDSKKPKMNSSHRPPDEFKYLYSHIEGAPGHSSFFLVTSYACLFHSCFLPALDNLIHKS